MKLTTSARIVIVFYGGIVAYAIAVGVIIEAIAKEVK